MTIGHVKLINYESYLIRDFSLVNNTYTGNCFPLELSETTVASLLDTWSFNSKTYAFKLCSLLLIFLHNEVLGIPPRRLL